MCFVSPPGYQTVHDPKIPYEGPIYGGLKIGMSLYIKGTVLPDGKYFNVDLRYREGCANAIVMHFNPRFQEGEGTVVMNCFGEGSWKNEERAGMPFTCGGAFELLITVTKDGYQFKVNGNDFYMFAHRMPVDRVTTLAIGGDIGVQLINIIGGKHGGICGSPGEGKMVTVPYMEHIAGGLRAGMSIHIQGALQQRLKGFHINLRCGNMKCSDIALHLRAWFRHHGGVLFNSFQCGGWRKEERPCGMPLVKGENFDLLIAATSEGYQVTINGNHFHLFCHRIPVHRACALEIGGHITLHTVNITGGGQEVELGRAGGRELVVHRVPFVGPISGGLAVGMSLLFQGTVHTKIHRFHINLMCGERRCADVAMLLSARFRPEEVLLFNSFRHGWKKPERVALPFRKGEDFELTINITSEGYQMIVNGEALHLFLHRVPVERVKAVAIGGDVTIKTVRILGGEEGGIERAAVPVVSSGPCMRPIFGGLRTGMSVYFQGAIPLNVNRFHINFNCGEMRCCDKALHINPRFLPMETVVFNNFRGGRWRREEKVTEMPFIKGETFEMIICITTDGFEVNVNGHHFYTFKHRLQVERVCALEVGGDVAVHTLNIVEAGEGDVQGQGLRELQIERIPHIGAIYGGLRAGMALLFRGTVLQKPKWFCINLQCGVMKCADIAFHFNPRFPPGQVVCNNFRHGWKTEERVPIPFREGEDFEIMYNVTPEGYQVTVDGEPLLLFRHRIPVERVKALAISGDITITSVSIIEADVPSIPEAPAGGEMVIPCLRHIPDGLRVGMSLYFKATVLNEADFFCINLRCGEKESGDIALHFNPRFKDQMYVALNTFRHHGWEQEVAPPSMPFSKGETFELIIAVTAEGYQMNVNGDLFYTFAHRMPVQKVNCLTIAGDITLHLVNVIRGGPAAIQEQPVKIVNTPFVKPLFVTLRSGMSVYIQGTVPQKVTRFQVDFVCGKGKCAPIAFHFNPRFCPCEYVVFNNLVRNRWRKELRVREMPFRKGEDFEMLFNISADGYQVVINGRPFHTFKHRMPVERVTAVEIGGQVFVQTVDIIEAGPGGEQIARGGLLIPKIPYVGPIAGGLKVGMCLFFQGTVHAEANRFYINLKSGQMRCSGIALHVNPRFRHGEVVVFNSCGQRGWQTEERLHKMPFNRGASFELIIAVTPDGYQIRVNGRKVHLFRHRVPIERVSALEIGGDVTMQTLTIIEGEPAPVPEPAALTEVLALPYMTPITHGLRVGMIVRVRGTIPSDSNSFSVNLLCGDKDGADIALHLNPRCNANVVVINTFRNGGWETEVKPEGMPFNRGEDFELHIIVTADGYQVKVKDQHFSFFGHRMPVKRVKAVRVVGDVSLHEVTIIGGAPGAIQIGPGVKEVVHNTPYMRLISGGLKPGMSVYIQGIVPHKPDRFAINFRCGEMKCADIAFHLNPRFCPCEVVVCNSFQRGWKDEERIRKMPFTRGERFEMVIFITPVGYEVNVNGHMYYTFKHRIQVERVTSLRIGGNVFVQTVNIIGGVKRMVQQLGLEELVVNHIPFAGPITGGLKPGMSLYFQGTVHRKLRRFHIDLRCGQMKCSDIAFHFNPRFGRHDYVVCNSFRHGWKKEEHVEKMPFTKGESFELVIAVTLEGFQVYVNGCHFCLFKHRVGVERVKTLEIGGGVSMQIVNIIRMNTPSMRPVSGLKPGMTLRFQGTVPHLAYRFSINLLCGDTEGSDNVFHFNPRFDQNEVVFNTFRNGGWEAEEKAAGMPFTRGGSFELIYQVLPDGYQVNVNGQPFYTFKHRIPLEQVQVLGILDDVCIHDIDISEGEPGVVPISPIELPMTVPYVRDIPESLRMVEALYIRGMVPLHCERFAINLLCAGTKDIAMHLNPRLTVPVVVFNSCRNGGWEEEDKPAEMPFRLGENFEVIVLIKSEGFQVLVNGRNFHLFRHRFPVEAVNLLEIKKEVILHSVEIIKAPRPEVLPVYPGVPAPEPPVDEIVVGNIPYVRPVSGILKPGMSVYFQGKIPLKCTNFYINFRCKNPADIAFHFKPWFSPCEVVVCNSLQNNSWQQEEKVTRTLFIKGESFEMAILITPLGYQVIINDCDFYTFNHRIPLEEVATLEVGGDVSVQTFDIMQIPAGLVICPEVPLDTDEEEEEEEEDEKEEPEPVEIPEPEVIICKVPQVRPMPSGLTPGMIVCIQGIIPLDITSFGINLGCGDKEDSDIAVQINPRFETPEMVVFRTRKGGSWEPEETATGMPFRKGEKFVLSILVTLESYQVTVNGVVFHTFLHRIPLNEVTSLEMDEDFSMNIVVPEPEGVKEQPAPEEPPVFVQPIAGGLKPGMSLYFQGTVPTDLNSFSITLLSGDQPGSDIVLHLSPQFDSNVVVFNTFQNGNWGEKETPEMMPFRKGGDFEILIIPNEDGYQVNVNNSPFYLYIHRIPFEQVAFLSIIGNVTVQTTKVIEPEEVQEVPDEEVVVSVPEYVQPIVGGLKTGMTLTFQGTVPDDVDSFSINLPCGTTEDSDIALRFTAHLEKSVLLFNCFRNGSWEEEEVVNVMPFRVGESFELLFIITVDGYQVVINSEQVYVFKHRISVELVFVMQVQGGISMQDFHTIKGEILEPEVVEVVVPYVQPISGGLKKGMSLYFQGSLPDQIDSFSIGLLCGEKEGCDVALDFNAQFEPKEELHFNSFRKGSWEKEETLEVMPFSEGEGFELVFLITEDGYQVNVNDKPVHFFGHRIDLDQVTAMKIVGRVSIETITITEVQQQTLPGYTAEIAVSPAEPVIEERVEVVPFVQPIPRLQPGMALYFQGSLPDETEKSPPTGPSGFKIDLMYGEAAGSDIALDFSVQLDDPVAVTFNAFCKGAWGAEEKLAVMPFAKGKSFELVFILLAHGYQVSVNGQQLHLFEHRMDMDKVCAVQITGNVCMQSLNIQETMTVDIEEGMGVKTTEMEVISGEPIQNPPIPFAGPITGGMTLKKTFVLTGSVPAEANSFICNFVASDSGDIAFQLNMLVSEGAIACNSVIGGNQGEEERQAMATPLQPGGSLEMLIRCGKQRFTVFLNGQHLCDFAHRLTPFTQIDKLEICGDVQLSYILF